MNFHCLLLRSVYMFIHKYSFGNSLKNFSCIRLVLHLRTIKYFNRLAARKRSCCISLSYSQSMSYSHSKSLSYDTWNIGLSIHILYIGRLKSRTDEISRKKIFEKNDSKNKSCKKFKKSCKKSLKNLFTDHICIPC